MGMKTALSPLLIAEAPPPCHRILEMPMNQPLGPKVESLALLSSQKPCPLLLQSQYPILPNACRFASRLHVHHLHRSRHHLATGLPMDRCPNLNQIQEMTVGIVHGIGEIETAGISESPETSETQETAEMIVGSNKTSDVIDAKVTALQLDQWTDKIVGASLSRSQITRRPPRRRLFSLAQNPGPRSQKSSQTQNRFTIASLATNL